MPGAQDVLGGPNGPAQPVIRYGTVLASPTPTAGVCWVEFAQGEPPADLPFLTSYVPVAGDRVAVAFAASGTSMQGLVLGGRAAQSGNLVVNANFYRAPILVFPPINAPPYHWSRYVASGSAALFCQVYKSSTMRFVGNVAGAGGAASGDTYVYSSAIPVTAGRSYYLTTTGHASVFANTNFTVQSRVAWFIDASKDYPDFSSETQFGTDTYGAATENDPYHFGTLTAPAAATHARVVMRNSFTSTGAGGGAGNMQWTEVVMLPA